MTSIFTSRNEVVAKVMFLHMSVILLPVGWGGAIPACLAAGLLGGFPGPHPRGKMRGIWSRPTAKGEIKGDLVQAHSQGGGWGGIWLGGRCLLQRDQNQSPGPKVDTPCTKSRHPPAGPKADIPVDQKQTPRVYDRYASYWNAFLFSLFSSVVSRASQSSFKWAVRVYFISPNKFFFWKSNF